MPKKITGNQTTMEHLTGNQIVRESSDQESLGESQLTGQHYNYSQLYYSYIVVLKNDNYNYN